MALSQRPIARSVASSREFYRVRHRTLQSYLLAGPVQGRSFSIGHGETRLIRCMD
jgi:hypothetical protein